MGEFLGVWAWGLFFCGMNGGTNGQTAVPLAVCPFCFFGGVRGGGLPEGDEPSALRWMAAKAEFPCGLPGGGVASALRWMWVG